MALEQYGYELTFKVDEEATTAEVNRIYKEVEAFEKKLNKQLREARRKEVKGDKND